MFVFSLFVTVLFFFQGNLATGKSSWNFTMVWMCSICWRCLQMLLPRIRKNGNLFTTNPTQDKWSVLAMVFLIIKIGRFILNISLEEGMYTVKYQTFIQLFCKSNISLSFQEVGGLHRDEVISWLVWLNSRFHFTPETVALSISITDRFLNLVKVGLCTFGRAGWLVFASALLGKRLTIFCNNFFFNRTCIWIEVSNWVIYHCLLLHCYVSLKTTFVLQVRPKYIQCVAISCFYIAAKTLEEDEVIFLLLFLLEIILPNKAKKIRI